MGEHCGDRGAGGVVGDLGSGGDAEDLGTGGDEGELGAGGDGGCGSRDNGGAAAELSKLT